MPATDMQRIEARLSRIEESIRKIETHLFKDELQKPAIPPREGAQLPPVDYEQS